VFEIEAIGVELGEGAGGDDYAWGVLGLDDVEGQVQGFYEGLLLLVFLLSSRSRTLHVETNGLEAIVWRIRECDKVYFRGGFVDGHFATVADGDFEEGGRLFRHALRYAVSPG
jgi:hypothetical protein